MIAISRPRAARRPGSDRVARPKLRTEVDPHARSFRGRRAIRGVPDGCSPGEPSIDEHDLVTPARRPGAWCRSRRRAAPGSPRLRAWAGTTIENSSSGAPGSPRWPSLTLALSRGEGHDRKDAVNSSFKQLTQGRDLGVGKVHHRRWSGTSSGRAGFKPSSSFPVQDQRHEAGSPSRISRTLRGRRIEVHLLSKRNPEKRRDDSAVD